MSVPGSVVAPTTLGAPPPMRFSLELLKEQRSEKLKFLFYGETGAGKTEQMLDLTSIDPNLRMLVFTFAGQTKEIKDGMFNSNPNIYVIDGLALYESQPEWHATSGAESVEFINWAMEQVVPTFHPHIIAFDGLEKMNRLGDGKMRLNHKLGPSQGFAERAWWKERNMAIESILRRAERAAELGVAQTVYYQKQYADEGSTTTRDKTPAYIDAIHGTMAVVVECRSFYAPMYKSNRYETYVQFARANLRDVALTGTTADVTWGYDAQTAAWVPKHFPWGPGLLSRFLRVQKKLAGVEVVYPEEASVPLDALREQHRYAPSIDTGEAPVVAPYAPPAPAYAAPTPPTVTVPAAPPKQVPGSVDL